MTNCRVLVEVFAKLENFSYPDREVPYIIYLYNSQIGYVGQFERNN